MTNVKLGVRGPRPGSNVDQISALDIGESLSCVRRYAGPDINVTQMREWSRRMSATLVKSRDRARIVTGGEYCVEAIDARTAEMAFIVGIVVTRLS